MDNTRRKDFTLLIGENHCSREITVKQKNGEQCMEYKEPTGKCELENSFITSSFNFKYKNQMLVEFTLLLPNKIKAKIIEIIQRESAILNAIFAITFTIKFHQINLISNEKSLNAQHCLYYTINESNILLDINIKKSQYHMDINKNSDCAFLRGVLKSAIRKKKLVELVSSKEPYDSAVSNEHQSLYQGQEFFSINFGVLAVDYPNKITRERSVGKPKKDVY